MAIAQFLFPEMLLENKIWQKCIIFHCNCRTLSNSFPRNLNNIIQINIFLPAKTKLKNEKGNENKKKHFTHTTFTLHCTHNPNFEFGMKKKKNTFLSRLSNSFSMNRFVVGIDDGSRWFFFLIVFRYV